MNSLIKLLSTASICAVFLFLVQPAGATDMWLFNIELDPAYFRDEPVTPAVTVKNNNVVAAWKNEWYVDLEYYQNGELQSSTTIDGVDLQPYTETTLTPSLPFSTSLLGKVWVTAKVNYLYEINPDNDELDTGYVTIMTPDEAKTTFTGKLSGYCPDATWCWAFMPPDALEPGTQLESEDGEMLSVSLDKYNYLAWLDCQPLAKYNHYSTVFTMNATDETDIQEYSIDGTFSIDGAYYLPGLSDKYASTDLIYGDVPDPEIIPDDNTVTEEEEPSLVQGDSVCVLIITGKTDDEFEKGAFDTDADLITQNLVKEKLGARVPASSIHLLEQPSANEIRSALFDMRGKCNTIYLFYSGHGWKGGMVTNDNIFNRLSYWDLGYELWLTEAQNIHVVVDACYAGTAVQAFRAREDNWEGRHVTVLASSSADTTSRFKYILTDANSKSYFASRFTWAFVQGYGDPAADTDGMPGVSFLEAFQWVRNENPETGGVGINEIQNPVYYEYKNGQSTTWVGYPVAVADEYSLGFNYPNPFNPVTRIPFTVPEGAGTVTIVILDDRGRKVMQLLNEKRAAGQYDVVWNGTDGIHQVSSGVYFVRMDAGAFTKIRKIMLIR